MLALGAWFYGIKEARVTKSRDLDDDAFDVLAAVLFDSSGRARSATAAAPSRPRRSPGPARAAG